jgi:hypothetical protein
MWIKIDVHLMIEEEKDVCGRKKQRRQKKAH